MLCDDLIADKVLLDLYDGLDKVYARIRAAQKFVLSKEFTLAADGLVDNFNELQKVAPWCRIPYPATWIEWVHADRPHWDQDGPHHARPVDPSRHQFAPHRIGLLLEQQGRASKWKSHLFWSMPTIPEARSPSPHNGSLAAVEFDAERCEGAADALVAAINPRVLADFGQKMIVEVGQMRGGNDIVRRLAEYAIEDWGGEIRFMTAVLGLLNTKNVAQAAKVDNEKMNAKRARHGKRPLFSHTILKIRPSLIRRVSGEGTGTHRNLRMHTVLGHFKRRQSGIFFWNAHVRGTIKHGVAFKDYEVDA